VDRLATLLYYSCGITDARGGLRAAPSAGATYPIETCAIVNDVEGVPAGIYRYLASTHELALIREGDHRRDLERAAISQRMVVEANVVVVLTAVFERTERRYGGRAQRYIAMEAGHIAQNVCLVATAIGLGTCAIGAFHDDAVNRVMGLDGRRESALYLVTIGTIERSNA